MYINLINKSVTMRRIEKNVSLSTNKLNNEQGKGRFNQNNFLVIKKIDINFKDRSNSKERSPKPNSNKNNLLISSLRNKVKKENDYTHSTNEKSLSKVLLEKHIILPKINNNINKNESGNNHKIVEISQSERKSENNMKERSNDMRVTQKNSSSLEKKTKIIKMMDSVDQLKQFQNEKKAMFQASKEKVYYVRILLI